MLPTLRQLIGVLLIGALGPLLSDPATAALVTQSATHSGGNSWTASFSVTNDGSLTEISSFTIYFDFSKVSNLVVLNSPSTWDSLAVDGDSGLSADGFFDALVLNPADALSAGASIGGFEVQFDWNDLAAPIGLAYTINDPTTFVVLESGFTSSDPIATDIPEPGSLCLAILALGAVARSTRGRRWCAPPDSARHA